MSSKSSVATETAPPLLCEIKWFDNQRPVLFSTKEVTFIYISTLTWNSTIMQMIVFALAKIRPIWLNNDFWLEDDFWLKDDFLLKDDFWLKVDF